MFFWLVTPRRLAGRKRQFGEDGDTMSPKRRYLPTDTILPQPSALKKTLYFSEALVSMYESIPYSSSALKMETICLSEALVSMYESIPYSSSALKMETQYFSEALGSRPTYESRLYSSSALKMETLCFSETLRFTCESKMSSFLTLRMETCFSETLVST
jgi:hypothetical protein